MISPQLDPSALRELLRLENPIRNYAWGSRTALARLLGREHPATEPEAELWVGAHPSSPSAARIGDRSVPLDDLVAAYPRELLGADADRGFPFLLKVLAAERPLSIQVHPDATHAASGFARENAAGIAIDAADRSYRDKGAKRELVLALSDFPALSGFRPLAQTARLLRELEIRELMTVADAFAEGLDDAGLRSAFARLFDLTLDPDLIRRLAARCAVVNRAEHRWVARLATAFPTDPAALAPLVLNLVELAAGEALLTEPGYPHAYLGGLAVELMTNSDNVVRCGLTEKPIDRTEMLRILRFEPRPPMRLTADATARGVTTFRTPGGELVLDLLDLETGVTADGGGHDLVEAVLVLAGRVEAATDAGHLALGPGEAFLAPAAAGPYRITGSGRAVRARVDRV